MGGSHDGSVRGMPLYPFTARHSRCSSCSALHPVSGRSYAWPPPKSFPPGLAGTARFKFDQPLSGCVQRGSIQAHAGDLGLPEPEWTASTCNHYCNHYCNQAVPLQASGPGVVLDSCAATKARSYTSRAFLRLLQASRALAGRWPFVSRSCALTALPGPVTAVGRRSRVAECDRRGRQHASSNESNGGGTTQMLLHTNHPLPPESGIGAARLGGQGMVRSYLRDGSGGQLSTARAVLRIAPIAADLRSGAVRVKGRACSIACDAEGTVEACRFGPHFSTIANGAMRKPTVRRQAASAVCDGWPAR
jgi:hypothetical protein